jgi:hypothetical protein
LESILLILTQYADRHLATKQGQSTDKLSLRYFVHGVVYLPHSESAAEEYCGIEQEYFTSWYDKKYITVLIFESLCKVHVFEADL